MISAVGVGNHAAPGPRIAQKMTRFDIQFAIDIVVVPVTPEPGAASLPAPTKTVDLQESIARVEARQSALSLILPLFE